ncbi:hypothetical protein Rsub_04225 [Raphidocelis subcapitata]|uniref:Ubiquitin-like domain-containing protein n=1 Tax=Raphidocelis subcapitata TaxID=307507 RepID=A0A2V0P341_9CHLO|nr:hypothetical protein Rsub_04225 [Raphidocelis subcapitata]|eukprot:GBF91485.1 hypothetical protein Rsub_04225 [Raphidocelis subcapitata]
MQLYVRVPGQRPSVAVELPSGSTVAQLRQALEDRTGIPAEEQLLCHGGRLLPAAGAAPLPPLPHAAGLDLLLRLAGGKGGFGALLRGQGRDGKITDNFDACRDLQGRRLRTLEAEKKLRDWAGQAKERELEKVAERHIRDLARQERQERDYEINVEAVRTEQREALDRVHEAVQDALAEGLAQGAGASGSGGGGGASSSDTAEEGAGGAGAGAGAGAAGAKRKAPEAAGGSGSGDDGAAGGPAAAAAAASKRPKRAGMLAMLDGGGSSDEDGSGSGSDDE